ncbi:MAG TPA: hypothetical protein VIQ03_11040 [Gammaproteobacteria bacterium]
MRIHFFFKSIAALALLINTATANASLTTSLQTLVSDLTNINTSLSSISVSNGNSCSQLGTLNTSIEDYIASLNSVYSQISSPLSLTTTDLTSLDDLSYLVKNMSSEAVRISFELRDIESIYEMFEYRAALSAMLRLSDDIGKMADRILEMSDRILVMADNIGAMATRILITQQLQNTNVALIQAAMLTTQQNMIAMSDSLSTIMYNLTLGQLSSDTQALLNNMNATVLNETNMASSLVNIQTTTTAVLTQTINAYVWATQNSQVASHYINGDTLTLLGDLSSIHKALALALENYANAINTLSPLTDNIILSDATASMLRLTQDIGVMSDRIMEMTDKIIIMADNIGLMADNIVATQNLQQTNIDLTANSILASQNTMITLIQNMGL